MLTLLKRAAMPLAISAAIGAGVMGCNSHTSASHVSASQSQVAKSDAKALLAKCIPTGATQQLQVASSLKSKAGRSVFAGKCGVPPQNKKAFEAAVLTAAESGHLTTKAGRTKFFSVTLPKIIEENQG